MNQSFADRIPAPSPWLQTCVVIPARDESEGIGKTLDCFARQRDDRGKPLNPRHFEIILLANNCRDETAALARAWGARHASISLHVIEAEFMAQEACIGHVRGTLMDLACQRLQSVPTTAPKAICSTDGDTRVSPFWISHTLSEMEAGARAVGGRIFLHGSAGEGQRIYLLDTAYHLMAARLEALLHAWPAAPPPRHFQFFGASLAICPALYAEVGGLPSVRCLEDMALGAELIRRDCEIRYSPKVQVWTSPRLHGRVEAGLSNQLTEWTALGQNHWLVPAPSEIEFKAVTRRRLHAVWSGGKADDNFAALAATLLVPPGQLESQLSEATYFGMVWEQIWNAAWENPDFRNQFPPVPVECALEQLRQRLEEIGGGRAWSPLPAERGEG